MSTKRKTAVIRFAKPQTTRSAKSTVAPRMNESKASIMPVEKQHAGNKKSMINPAIEISSDEDDEDKDIDAMDEDVPQAAEESYTAERSGVTNTSKNTEDEESEDHEPTFGDLVHEHETVDVTAALGLGRPDDISETNDNSEADARPGAGPVNAVTAAPALSSLGHLLNAALRTGDDANLEVCFNTTTDTVWVRNTIQRLDPTLAGVLLQKLAARIHRRPGRAHTLIGWVQWTLITHGGALLANQPGITRSLQELHRVLEERARGLNSLLLLKGKLDMLEAQMQMRRLQRAGGSIATGYAGSQAINTVSNTGRGRTSRRATAGAAGYRNNKGEEYMTLYHEGWDKDSDGESEAGQIHVNGNSAIVIAESDDEEEIFDNDDDSNSDDMDADDDDDEDDLEEVYEEAEDDEIDFDDVDEDEDEDEDDDENAPAAALPPAKVQKKAGGGFSKGRFS